MTMNLRNRIAHLEEAAAANGGPVVAHVRWARTEAEADLPTTPSVAVPAFHGRQVIFEWLDADMNPVAGPA
jgi:hypothetical protein